MLLSHCQDQVLTLSFNRPDALNAFTPDLLQELTGQLQEVATRDDVRVVVLRGEGRAFSAGVDLKVLLGISPEAGRVGTIFDGPAYDAANAIRKTPVPVIARVHGFCFTGALELALHADFILTTSTTKFGDTHAKWGLRPTWGMSQNLARAVGVRRARELSFTAKTFSGQEALAWGLANHAVEDEAALDALTTEIADAIVAGSPGACSAYKQLYAVHEQDLGLETALDRELEMEFPEITDTADRLKGFG
ncbi:MAG: enoyl-CoA hydratase/isomerase family protein [Pseudomonadota bacterium]